MRRRLYASLLAPPQASRELQGGIQRAPAQRTLPRAARRTFPALPSGKLHAAQQDAIAAPLTSNAVLEATAPLEI